MEYPREISCTAALLVILSFAFFLACFLLHANYIRRRIRVPNLVAEDLIPKNDDDYVTGARVNVLQNKLQFAYGSIDEFQNGVTPFLKFWMLVWTLYGAILFSLVFWSSRRNEDMISSKLDAIVYYLEKTYPRQK